MPSKCQGVECARTDAQCTDNFRMCRAFHTRLRRIVRSGVVEHGGDTYLDFNGRYIKPASEQTGTFASVDLTRGIVDWHTHPATCLNKKTCTIGLPSPADLSNVAMGVSMGNQAHLVYSSEGTYTIQMDHLQIRRLLGDGVFAREYPKYVHNETAKIFSKYGKIPAKMRKNGKLFTASSQAAFYARFSREYIQRAHDLGFIIRLFQGDALPSVYIGFQCGNNGKELAMDL